jgi:hypothetical protein
MWVAGLGAGARTVIAHTTGSGNVVGVPEYTTKIFPENVREIIIAPLLPTLIVLLSLQAEALLMIVLHGWPPCLLMLPV